MTIANSLRRTRVLGKVADFLRLIRFSHTIFALPFAMGSLIVAANGWPGLRVFLLVLGCMIAARTAAMLFNRFVDWELDQRNPRTNKRHLLASRPTVLGSLIVSSVLFFAAAAAINRLTLILSPVALAIIFFYSTTKRFTDITHFILGAALAIAPIGAWIAQTGRIDLPPVALAAGVVVWVAGFDIIYATQDYRFDRERGLHSLVVRLGVQQSLRLAQWLHLIMLVFLAWFGMSANLGMLYFASLPVIAAALWYEHRSIKQFSLAGINRAFFNSNAFVSGAFLLAVLLDRLA